MALQGDGHQFEVPMENEGPALARPSDRILVAYIFRSAGTPAEATALLREYVENYADRAGYTLDSTFVGVEGQTDRFTIEDLLQHIERCGADTVIVAGPAHTALQRTRSLSGVRVLTLGDVALQMERLDIRASMSL